MSINLRLATFARSDGTLNASTNVTAFRVAKISIDQTYDTKADDEKFSFLLTEENGAIHRITLYCLTPNTEIELTPEADRRLNGIPQAARGSIVNMVVPNDHIDTPVVVDTAGAARARREERSYRSDDVVRNTTPLD